LRFDPPKKIDREGEVSKKGEKEIIRESRVL